MEQLYNKREESYDITFIFPGELLDGKPREIRGHTFVLRSKSPFFEGLFEFHKDLKEHEIS